MKDQQWASVDEELELGGDTGEKMGQGDPKTLMCHNKRSCIKDPVRLQRLVQSNKQMNKCAVQSLGCV